MAEDGEGGGVNTPPQNMEYGGRWDRCPKTVDTGGGSCAVEDRFDAVNI